MTPEPNPEHRAAVMIADYHVTLSHRKSLMVTVYFEEAVRDIHAIVEGEQSLLLHRGVSITRGIALFKQYKSHVLVTIFTEEYQHLNKGAAIAFLL